MRRCQTQLYVQGDVEFNRVITGHRPMGGSSQTFAVRCVIVLYLLLILPQLNQTILCLSI